MSSVTPLKPGLVPHEKQPDPDCVKAAEMLLERAKAGEIVGVSIVATYSDGAATFWSGGFVGGFSALGALACLQQELVEAALSDE